MLLKCCTHFFFFKCCTHYASKFGKLRNGHRTGKGQFSLQFQRKGNAKECSNYRTIALISRDSKIMPYILQTRHRQYVNRGLPDVQAVFRKGRGTRDQIAKICWITEKGNSKKPSTSASLTTLKPLTMDHNKLWKILKKRWEYQTTLPASCKTST